MQSEKLEIEKKNRFKIDSVKFNIVALSCNKRFLNKLVIHFIFYLYYVIISSFTFFVSYVNDIKTCL